MQRTNVNTVTSLGNGLKRVTAGGLRLQNWKGPGAGIKLVPTHFNHSGPALQVRPMISLSASHTQRPTFTNGGIRCFAAHTVEGYGVQDSHNCYSKFQIQRLCKRLLSTNADSKIDQQVDNEQKHSGEVHVIHDTETVQGPLDKHEFQAETRQLLDIVARSLYSEKEVFIREIISNASDALEKLRHHQLTGQEFNEPELPFEIHLTTNEEKGTFTIQDYGIGMLKEELIENLGTIARSGSKAFVKGLQEGDSGMSAGDSSIIGQFGVGFYSTFMVGGKIDVYTKSYKPGSTGYLWTSDGSGTYEVAEADGVSRGTKIIVHLKDDAKRFAFKSTVEDVIKKYSNFVGFPIYLNGTKINTVEALWMLDEKNVTSEQHEEFYQFITNTSDKPRYQLIYKTDAPLNIRSLFYIPTSMPELYGFGRMEPGVSLYSRKVLIQAKAEKVLPDWLRFVRGVVDSEDIPLNLSRELLQDSALIKKLSKVLASKLVRFFQDQMKRDRVKYEKFFKEFGMFFREGVVIGETQEEREDVAKLLRFESSSEKAGTQKTLEQYVKDMKPGQKNIFYLCAPSRELAESSPYFEALKKQEVEVLFSFDENDDVVLHQLKEFGRKPLVSAETYLTKTEDKVDDGAQATSDEPRLSESEAQNLATWFENSLGKGKVAGVKPSKHNCSGLKGAFQRRADTGQPDCLMTLFNDICLMMLLWCWQGLFNSKQSCFDE